MGGDRRYSCGFRHRERLLSNAGAMEWVDCRRSSALDQANAARTSKLTAVLTYHVVAGQLGPDEVAGTHKTVNGADVTVDGSGDAITVGEDTANVICGGVKTANATVYLIDAVLMPPA